MSILSKLCLGSIFAITEKRKAKAQFLPTLGVKSNFPFQKNHPSPSHLIRAFPLQHIAFNSLFRFGN
jgi:hypothetical protein